MPQKLNNIPVTMDDTMLGEIDRVAEDMKLSRSAVMRDAIRKGLPLVKTGGAADVITLDSELSKDVDKIAEGLGWSRAQVLIECIRVGLPAVQTRHCKLESSDGTPLPPEKIEEILQAMRETNPDWYPYGREMIKLRARLCALERILDDLREHAPEAQRRYEAMMRLAALRAQHGPGGGMPYGLSQAEIERQIALYEKYGDFAHWPKDTGAGPRATPPAGKRKPGK